VATPRKIEKMQSKKIRIYLSIYLIIYLPTYPSIHPSIYLSLPVHPFIQLSTKKQTQDQSSGRHSDGAGCPHRNSSILRCKNKNITELTYQCKIDLPMQDNGST